MNTKTRYTANILFDNKPVESLPGNDINRLTAFLMNYIESVSHDTLGIIIDNSSGCVVQRCIYTRAES